MAIMDTYTIGGVTGKLVRQVDKDTVVLYDGKNNIEVKIPKGQEPKKGLKACSNCKKEQSITNFKRYKNGNYTSMCEKCRKMVYKANKQPKIKPEPTKVEGEILKVPVVEKALATNPTPPIKPTSDPIEPEHYRKGEIDLYESWYLTRPFNEFRAIMEAVAERYMKRDKDNRIEDIDKGIYTLQRLREYEVRHEQEMLIAGSDKQEEK